MHVKISRDIDKALEKKICNKAKAKCTIQPFLIVVGPNKLELNRVFVQVGSFRLGTSTFSEGLDLLFKLYLMFKLAYPAENRNIWYFIQWGIYEIKTESDVQIPLVYNILNKLKVELNSQLLEVKDN